MDKDYLQKQLDLLWNKVGDQALKVPQEKGDLVSAFEAAQAELQAESLNLLKSRFEKEKAYWENLIASKDEAISRLQAGILNEKEKSKDLKSKIEELRNYQASLVQQSFGALDLQKRSLGLRIEQLEKDLESARTEILNLDLWINEEKERQEKAKRAWEFREKELMDERDGISLEVARIKQDLFQKREAELEELTRLDSLNKSLKTEIADLKTIYQTEKEGLQNLIREKESQEEKTRQDLELTRSQLEKEREERRLAAVERERQSVQGEEDRKRLVEQLLNRETKIKELQESLENLIKDKTAQEESLRAREREIIQGEESLKKRREEWVESIKGQSNQQLNISEKAVDLLSKLETKVAYRSLQSSPPLPSLFSGGIPKPPALTRVLQENPGRIQRLAQSLKRKKGAILLVSGLALFLSAAVFLFMEGEGRRLSRAQKYLEEGNAQFSKGDLELSLKSLQKAYDLDPENSMVKNSLTLVLGELADREYRDGKYDDALKHAEILSRLLPEDADVLQLHNKILQAMGKKQSAPTPQQPILP